MKTNGQILPCLDTLLGDLAPARWYAQCAADDHGSGKRWKAGHYRCDYCAFDSVVQFEYLPSVDARILAEQT